MNLRTTAELTDAEMERAWRAKDASCDGLFYFAVKTTGIFCRPTCPSRPKREHVEFFRSPSAALGAGYRPCKRCHPELANGQPPPWVAGLLERTLAAPDTRWKAEDLRALAVPPERARRWFQRHYGMTFTAWCRGLRLSTAFLRLRRGEKLDDVILDHGYESHSGFREAFARAFGAAPGGVRDRDCLRVRFLPTPLGPMLAGADQHGLRFLEFADRRRLEQVYAGLRRRFGLPVAPGETELLAQASEELGQYFDGTRREFSVPVVLRGTPFQERVWRALQGIPYGQTASYAQIARQVRQPAAVRAVARANATNPICLLVPCHRVIGHDGSLSGYGGGQWRKRLLLELERTGKLPG